jgi:hypothetical protein
MGPHLLSLPLRFSIVFTAVLANVLHPAATALPNGTPAIDAAVQAAPASLPTLPDFIQTVKNGNPASTAGVYASGVFAYPVVEQPAGNPAFVSPTANVLTHFSLADSFGSLGFVAHNNLAGSAFPSLRVGNTLVVIKGDGSQQSYLVSQIRRFKAVTPNSPYSNYIDLDLGGQLTYQELFMQTYGQKGMVVLQTCISNEGVESWGRLFVLATPVVSSKAATGK